MAATPGRDVAFPQYRGQEGPTPLPCGREETGVLLAPGSLWGYDRHLRIGLGRRTCQGAWMPSTAGCIVREAAMNMAPRETLTSRERVVRTLNRQPVDRYPIDLGSHFPPASRPLPTGVCEYLELALDDIWVPDVVQMLAHVDGDILERFHCDCVLLWPRWSAEQRWQPYDAYRFAMPAAMPLQRQPDGGWQVRQGRRQMRMPARGHFFDGEWISDWRTEPPEVLAATARRRAHQRDALCQQLYGVWRLAEGIEGCADVAGPRQCVRD